MLNVHLERPKHLTLHQRIELQKRLITILSKKHKDYPTKANWNDLNNEIRILKCYDPEIDIQKILEPIEFIGYQRQQFGKVT